MELKQDNNTIEEEVTNLLIVPYGIETFIAGCLNACGFLLIVPYGIET